MELNLAQSALAQGGRHYRERTGSHARAEPAAAQGEPSPAVGKALRREGAEWKASPKSSYTLEVGGE